MRKSDGSSPVSGRVARGRRRFLKAVGALGVAGLAGCGGDGEESSPTTTPTSTPGGTEPATEAPPTTAPDTDTATGPSTGTTAPDTDTATETRTATPGEERTVVFLTGGASHGFAEHAHAAGTTLLADRLERNAPNVTTRMADKWPDDPEAAFEDVDSVVMYFDGGGGHVATSHASELRSLAERGVGMVPIHYAVEVPKAQGETMLAGVGGYFEPFYSVNPFWKPAFTDLPDHPVTAGVRPFSIRDEWYYHMRFTGDRERVTPILTDVPPDGTITDRWSPGSDASKRHGNEAVYEAVVENDQPQHVAWAYEGEWGNRGFGFTGGHFHWMWGHDQVRKLLLNAIAWTAGAGVPDGGITSETPAVGELLKNLDYEPPGDFDRSGIEADLDAWNGGPATVSVSGPLTGEIIISTEQTVRMRVTVENTGSSPLSDGRLALDAPSPDITTEPAGGTTFDALDGGATHTGKWDVTVAGDAGGEYTLDATATYTLDGIEYVAEAAHSFTDAG